MASPKRKSLGREIIEVLKEQRTLFALMVAYAGAIVAALFHWAEITRKWNELNNGRALWILYAFAFGPVLVPVAMVILRRWVRARLERRLVDSGPDPLKIKHGYFRPGPYSGDAPDRAAYTRTDHAHEQALDRIRKAATADEPFFFLHSLSGCGKTSLLSAFVVPALEAQGWRVIALRGFTGILPELAEALGVAKTELGVAKTATVPEITSALTAAAAEARNSGGGTLLVVVDQFEEFLILHPQESAPWAMVRDWFTALRAAPVPGLLVLLSLRSEYQAPALKLGLADFDSTRSYVVPLFTREDAREFLRRGLESGRKKTDALPYDQFLQQMEDRDDTRGLVRPIQANLVGHAYRTFADEFHARLLAGKRVDFLADWLRRLLERRELRLHARPVFEGLLQKDGSRCPARVAQIATEAALDPDVVRHCLTAFEAEGLVRCLTPNLPDDRQKLWEISHDFLAVQIKRLLSFWHHLWHESLARALAPVALGLWLVGAAVFFSHDTSGASMALELGDLGLHWTAHNRSVGGYCDTESLAKAGPLLRKLGCQHLDLSECDKLENVDGLKSLTALTSLDLSACPNLKNVDGLKSLTALTSLNLSGCANLENVDVLESLKRLTALTGFDLHGCANLKNVDGLKSLTALTNLNLSGCANLKNVDRLNSLKALTNLNLSFCTKLENVDDLENLTALTSLDLSGCPNLKNVDGLNSLTALTSLDLHGCGNLKNIDGLTSLTALTSLYLAYCPNLENVEGLTSLPALASLDLTLCDNLKNVDGLIRLTALTSLNLSFCHYLENVDGLNSLTTLTGLDLSYCNKLENVDRLKSLTALKNLNLYGCPKLSKEIVLGLVAALPSTHLNSDLLPPPIRPNGTP